VFSPALQAAHEKVLGRKNIFFFFAMEACDKGHYHA
jgi:hypothetical protein